MNDEINEIDLARVDLNLLVALAALHRTRSVKKAAKRLALTPSAVSMALGRLRHLFDDPLFVRERGEMVPTARAESTFARLRPALVEIRDAIAGDATFDPVRSEHVLRVGVSDDLAPALVPMLRDRLRAKAPRVRLVVRHATATNAAALLDGGEAELAIVGGAIERSRRLGTQVLAHESFWVLFDRRAMPWKGRLTRPRYLAADHVIVSSSGRLRGLVDEHLAAQGLERRVVLALGHYGTVADVVRGRPLLAEVPRPLALAHARHHRFSAVPLPFGVPRFPSTLAWLRRDERDPALAWMRAQLAGLVAAMHE